MNKKDEKRKAANGERTRYQVRLQRLEREKQEQGGRYAQKTGAAESVNTSSAGEQIKAVVQAALRNAVATQIQPNEKNNKEADS